MVLGWRFTLQISLFIINWIGGEKDMKGFVDFVRERGVIGLAVGFILGGAVAKMVTALVTDLLNPLIGLLMGGLNLKNAYIQIGMAKFMWGDFISTTIDFLIVAFVVYFGVKILKLDKLDKKKVTI
jgi:large conductance mechanosensitive channel